MTRLKLSQNDILAAETVVHTKWHFGLIVLTSTWLWCTTFIVLSSLFYGCITAKLRLYYGCITGILRLFASRNMTTVQPADGFSLGLGLSNMFITFSCSGTYKHTDVQRIILEIWLFCCFYFAIYLFFANNYIELILKRNETMAYHTRTNTVTICRFILFQNSRFAERGNML